MPAATCGCRRRVAAEGTAETPEQRTDLLRASMEASRLLHEMPKPTIAMLNGVAAGAGMSLALACDLRIAGRSARMTTAFAKVGLSGDYGGTWFLTQLVGTARARELYFLSDVLDAARIEALGLANRVVADEELAAETMALARAAGERAERGAALHEAKSERGGVRRSGRWVWTARRTGCCAAVPARTTRRRRRPLWRSVRRCSGGVEHTFAPYAQYYVSQWVTIHRVQPARPILLQ